METRVPKALEVGKVYMTKFQTPEPVTILEHLGKHSVYVTYNNSPQIGRCLLRIDSIVPEYEPLPERDIRLYYFKDGIMQKIGPGSTLHSVKHRHKSITACKEAIHNHKLSKYDLKKRFVQFVIVEYTGTLNAKIVEVVNKDYIKDYINETHDK